MLTFLHPVSRTLVDKTCRQGYLLTIMDSVASTVTEKTGVFSRAQGSARGYNSFEVRSLGKEPVDVCKGC
jgi:hypothetical protein